MLDYIPIEKVPAVYLEDKRLAIIDILQPTIMGRFLVIGTVPGLDEYNCMHVHFIKSDEHETGWIRGGIKALIPKEYGSVWAMRYCIE